MEDKKNKVFFYKIKTKDSEGYFGLFKKLSATSVISSVGENHQSHSCIALSRITSLRQAPGNLTQVKQGGEALLRTVFGKVFSPIHDRPQNISVVWVFDDLRKSVCYQKAAGVIVISASVWSLEKVCVMMKKVSGIRATQPYNSD